MDFQLELVVLPVSDVDRAKAFYEQAGFNADHDHQVSDEIRFVQLTPPGSPTSIAIGTGLTEMAPGSLEGLQLVVADVELGELPNVCAHFVVSPAGRIFQLVNLRTRCRHTVGLNWTAIGIEHAGYRDGDVLDNPAARRASLWLTQYLRCRFQIGLGDVIGHNESLGSPYHHELVPSLRRQTHGDWTQRSMRVYRQKLGRMAPC